MFPNMVSLAVVLQTKQKLFLPHGTIIDERLCCCRETVWRSMSVEICVKFIL